MTEMKLDFQKQGGLIPAIILDHTSKEILMLAYLNEEAYQLTCTSGQMWYWSRSVRHPQFPLFLFIKLIPKEN